MNALRRIVTLGTLGAICITASAGDAPVPVVVELFTSEGCSSCPPADRLLAELSSTQPVPGTLVIPLAHHVDYWDRLGWRDRFSSAQATARQERYARRFEDQVYTPQIVIDGSLAMVGSRSGKVRDAIRSTLGNPRATVTVTAAPVDGRSVDVRVSVGDLPLRGDGESVDVVLFVTEDGLSSQVSRGENAGRDLRHQAVVRATRQLGKVDVSTGTFRIERELRLPADSEEDRLRLVVLVQERRGRRILGAATTSLR